MWATFLAAASNRAGLDRPAAARTADAGSCCLGLLMPRAARVRSQFEHLPHALALALADGSRTRGSPKGSLVAQGAALHLRLTRRPGLPQPPGPMAVRCVAGRRAARCA